MVIAENSILSVKCTVLAMIGYRYLAMMYAHSVNCCEPLTNWPLKWYLLVSLHLASTPAARALGLVRMCARAQGSSRAPQSTRIYIGHKSRKYSHIWA